MWYILTREYYSTTKKNEKFPLVATEMDLEGIVLSEMSDRERQIQYIIYMWDLKIYNKLMNKTKKQTHRCGEQISGYQ